MIDPLKTLREDQRANNHAPVHTHLEIMQRSFVRYIQRGPRYYEEPADSMGVIIHNTLILFYHVFPR